MLEAKTEEVRKQKNGGTRHNRQGTWNRKRWVNEQCENLKSCVANAHLTCSYVSTAFRLLRALATLMALCTSSSVSRRT